MNKFADLVDKNIDDLAPWEGKSMGQPVGITKAIYPMLSAAFRCQCDGFTGRYVQS